MRALLLLLALPAAAFQTPPGAVPAAAELAQRLHRDGAPSKGLLMEPNQPADGTYRAFAEPAREKDGAADVEYGSMLMERPGADGIVRPARLYVWRELRRSGKTGGPASTLEGELYFASAQGQVYKRVRRLFLGYSGARTLSPDARQDAAFRLHLGRALGAAGIPDVAGLIKRAELQGIVVGAAWSIGAKGEASFRVYFRDDVRRRNAYFIRLEVEEGADEKRSAGAGELLRRTDRVVEYEFLPDGSLHSVFERSTVVQETETQPGPLDAAHRAAYEAAIAKQPR